MKDRQIIVDVQAEKLARTQMNEIAQLLDQVDDATAEGLRAEYARLDGSWLTEIVTDLPGVLSEDEAAVQQAEIDRLVHNAAIKAELAANDLGIVRALVEGDQDRISAHQKKQAALRAQLA